MQFRQHGDKALVAKGVHVYRIVMSIYIDVEIQYTASLSHITKLTKLSALQLDASCISHSSFR